MQPMSTGFIKVGNDYYINPNNIMHIGRNEDGTTQVTYNIVAQGPNGVAPTADRIPVDTDRFAQCAVKAMQTGEIIDIMG